MKEVQKSEFISKMEEIAQQASALVSGSEESKSVIIIATDFDGNGTMSIIGCSGKNTELTKGLVAFGQDKRTEAIFGMAANEVALEKIVALFDEKSEEGEKECEKVEKEGE
jgi:hypothetical protein